MEDDQGFDANLGASRLQEWDFGDLNFDAVLQSFDQPSVANGANRRDQPATSTDMQLTEQISSGPPNMSGEMNSMTDLMDDAFDQNFSNDVLFGFGFPDSRDL